MITDSEDLKLVGKIYRDCIAELYFYYMSMECECGKCDKVTSLTDELVSFTCEIIEELHDKYADHVEGFKRK